MVKGWARTVLLGVGALLGVLAAATLIHVSKKGLGKYRYGLTVK